MGRVLTQLLQPRGRGREGFTRSTEDFDLRMEAHNSAVDAVVNMLSMIQAI